ncbi:MAG: major capsid protein, partial [Ruminococcus sp.]|nr:major capsid protein [Ruminococcus sp.]
MNWEDGIFGKIPATEWLKVPFDVRRQTDPADILFGDEKTENLTASWQSINAMYQVPEMAQFHAFDTVAGTTYRLPVDNHNIEKGLIKVKINQSERLQAIKNSVRADDLFKYVIDDAMRLSEQVITRTKVAKNEVLATGKFTIKENNLNLTVDYGVSDDQTKYEIDFAKSADVPAQIQEIIDNASDMGITLTGIYTSKRILSKMRSHGSVQKAINGVNSVGAMVTNSQLTAYLADEYGITQIITNDNIYNADNNRIGTDGRPIVTTKRYYPADKITFFSATSNGRIGVGLWGNPPEAINTLMNTTTSTESPYIHILQWTENDPAVLWTKASGLFVPVLY